MKNYVINQHFVPQFYLKKFTDKDDKLHCYNKCSHKKYSAHTIDICRKKNLYETEFDSLLQNGEKFILHNGIENMFKDVEGIYSIALPKILSKCINNCNGVSLICSASEKSILADMVTNFLVRNPYAVEGFFDNEITSKMMFENNVTEVNQVMIELGFGTAKPLVELAQKISLFNPETEEGIARQIKNLLKDMSVSFLVSNELGFVTSDCPVIHQINNDKLTYVLMTLSPNVAIIYCDSDSSNRYRNKAILLTEKEVDKLNKLYLSYENAYTIIASNMQLIDTLLESLE